MKTRASSRAVGAMLLAAIATAGGCQAFTSDFAEFGGERVRDPRDRAAQHDATVELRLDLLLPDLMERAGLDCWLVVSDGFSDDPMVAMLTVSATHPEGTIALLLCREGAGVGRFALGRGLAANAGIYEVVEPSRERPLEELLNRRLQASDPARIGIDDARSFAPGDGLSASNARWVRERLAAPYGDRLVSSRPVAEDFLATQLDVEGPLLAESARLTAAILDQVLSDQVVVAAGTSLGDLDWAVRERAAALDVELPFPPRTLVYRSGATLDSERDMGMDLILQPGDLVYLTAGIDYLGYAHRVGRWAYLLPTGEREAPQWMVAALAELADVAERVTGALAPGQAYDQVVAAAAGAAAGLTEGRVAVDRVGRLREGPVDPARRDAVSGAWRPDYRLAADTAVTVLVEGTFAPPDGAFQPLVMLTLDTVLVTASGARLVVAPQLTPLLID